MQITNGLNADINSNNTKFANLGTFQIFLNEYFDEVSQLGTVWLICASICVIDAFNCCQGYKRRVYSDVHPYSRIRMLSNAHLHTQNIRIGNFGVLKRMRMRHPAFVYR